jgi:hypothetical protein
MDKIHYIAILALALLMIVLYETAFGKGEAMNSTSLATTGAVEDKENKTISARLVSVSGGYWVPSAGYYEGELNLTDTSTGNHYIIFVCSKDWSWVRNSSCYELNPREVSENVKLHIYSAELSGCYVGKLNIASC